MAVATNGLLTFDVITNEALRVFRNNFVVASRSTRPVDDLFGSGGMKGGDTIRVRIPPRYTSTTGPCITKQNSVETNSSITLIQRNIGMGFQTKDLTLSIDTFSKRFIEPAMIQLSNDIDGDGFAAMYAATNLVTPGAYTAGVPAAWTGADVSTLRPFLEAGARLDEAGAPRDNQRYIAITPSINAAVVDGLKGLFQDASQIGAQYKKGLMGISGGFEWAVAQNLSRFTAGTRVATGAATVDGNQTGASLLLAAAGNALTVKAGDQFVIAGVYQINPLSRAASNKLQVFTSLTDQTSSAGGAVTLSISPSINVTAPNQTVSAQAGTGAAVSFMGAASASSEVNFAWHKDAMMFASVPLEDTLPGAKSSSATDPESGLSVRLVQSYEADCDELVTRLDVLYGFKLIRPELAVKIMA